MIAPTPVGTTGASFGCLLRSLTSTQKTRPAGRGDLQSVKQQGDRVARAGHPLKPRTIQTALGELEAAGMAQGSEEGNGRARYWSPATPDTAGRGEGAAGPAPRQPVGWDSNPPFAALSSGVTGVNAL
jgi:hypothetical protein